MSDEPQMTFDWSGQHRSSWVLAGLISLSLILHSAAFFFVHITTPERQLIPKAAQPIQLLTPYGPDGAPSPENEAVLRWIAAEDPAVVARVLSVEPKGLLEVPFRPSFAVSRTLPRDVPSEQATLQYPPARDSMEYILSADERPPVAAPASTAQGTAVTFHSPLQARAPSELKLSLATKSPQSLSTVQLLAGVAATGEVRFCFVQEKSGVPAMDAEAVRLVSGIRLAAAPDALVWGTVSVRWGIDAVEEKP